jgi:hypothetical protein
LPRRLALGVLISSRLDVGGRAALLVGAIRFDGQWPSSVARGYQSSSSFEPSVAAVIIAGMPIAAAASVKIRASIIIFPVICPYVSAHLIGIIRSRLADQHLPRACFSRVAPPKFLVSRVVAKTGPAFHRLWQEFDTSTSRRRETQQRAAMRQLSRLMAAI